jgi:group I intron endonuclease
MYEIYLIESNDYWYVGSTAIGVKRRFQEHLRGSRSGAELLRTKIRELGSDQFTVTILEGHLSERVEAERRWYDWYLANDSRQTLNGRRPCTWGGWPKGKRHTPETIAKMKELAQGHLVTDATRAKISEAQRQIPHVGRSHTAEAKQKMSNAKKGKPLGPFTQDHKDRISAGLKGHSVSPETRAKISASMRARRLK